MVPSGSTIVQYTCDPNGEWQFRYTPVGGHAYTYKREWENTGQCLGLPPITMGELAYLSTCTNTPSPGSGEPGGAYPQLFWAQANLTHGGPI